ncbi:MAG: Zn-dependent hydrolase [Veillonellales bacterium]
METQINRIRQVIKEVTRFNSTPGEGYSRFSYSEQDRQAREYFSCEFLKLGLKVRVDGVGNIRARLEGDDPSLSSVMIGSHIDTVLHGGKFDGLLGVAAALEVVRVIVDNKLKLLHPIEIIIFTEEEGSNFGSTMAGSKAMTGKYTLNDLKNLKNNDGISMYETANDFGLYIDNIENQQIKPGSVKAMLEMHIEQGSILDNKKIPIGIVEAVAGSKLLRVEIQGLSNHAGATPMNLRKDPMVAAAKIISAVEKIVREEALNTTVGTVGKIFCYPNVPNCIPGKVSFTVDVRDVTAQGIELAVQEINRIIKQICDLHEVSANVGVIAESNAFVLSEKIINLLEKTALRKKLPYIRMNSGAVHDSCMMTDVTDVGIIFVPSIDGRSHVPEEDTRYEDIKLGSDLLLETVLMLAGEAMSLI